MSRALLLLFIGLLSCGPQRAPPVRLVIDTDANNELDDQHAIAWAILNSARLSVEGVTVNATWSGGDITAQRAEAERVVALVGSNVPVIEGANGSLESIAPGIEQPGFDGHAAAEFLAARGRDGPFTVLALGKLTNVALALMKEPTLAEKMRVVWLGSNFPLPGEYNLENDPQAARFVLDHAAVFEIVTVRYGEATGTDAVRITLDEIRRRMPGLGPHVSAVEGRHGGSFEHFGDYSLDLFSHAEPNGDPPSRPLFDLAAAAIVAEPGWAGARTIPAPALDGVAWNEVPHQERTITLWEHFERDAIVEGLFTVLSAP